MQHVFGFSSIIRNSHFKYSYPVFKHWSVELVHGLLGSTSRLLWLPSTCPFPSMLKLKAAKGQEEVVQFYNKHQWWTQIQTFHHFMSKLMMTLTIQTFPTTFLPARSGWLVAESQPCFAPAASRAKTFRCFLGWPEVRSLWVEIYPVKISWSGALYGCFRK